MNKANKLEELMDELLETFVAKNEDYGDSFADSFKEFGMTSAVVRMNDKMNRIKSLSKKGDRQVKDESLRDSLMDLANYALMTVVELEDEGEQSEIKSGPFDKYFSFNPVDMNWNGGRVTFTGTLRNSDEEDDDDELDDYEDEYNDDFHNTDEELGIDCLEDGKEYYLKSLLSGIDEDENYLNLDQNDGGYTLADSHNCSWSQTQFTKDEIRNLVENWDVNLDDFEIIEVKSDYEAGRQENL